MRNDKIWEENDFECMNFHENLREVVMHSNIRVGSHMIIRDNNSGMPTLKEELSNDVH
jgi:hypothetical protein